MGVPGWVGRGGWGRWWGPGGGCVGVVGVQWVGSGGGSRVGG